MEDFLPGALAEPGAGGLREFPRAARVLAPRRRWVPLAAAAALLLAVGLAWRGEPTPPPVPPAPVSSALLGEAVWHSGQGTAAVLAAGARARQSEGGLALEAGELWVESAVPFRVETPLGSLMLLEGRAWVWLEVPASAAWIREAQAASPPRVRVALVSGKAVWGSDVLAEGEMIQVSEGVLSREPWKEKDRVSAWAASIQARGWVDLLAAGRLRASASLRESGGILALESQAETAWVRAEVPVSAGYVLEFSGRVSGENSRAALAYPADGRFPVVDLEGTGWQEIRVVASGLGTEVWTGERIALRLAPGALAGASLRDHGLQAMGLLLWHGGKVEVRRWRVKILDGRGMEVSR